MLDDEGERSPHEPDEFDPNSLGPDPPEIPEPSANPGDADPEVRGLFWILVLVANAALIAVSLGLMFIVFQGAWGLGAQLFVAGVVLGVYVYYRVREFQSD